MKKQLILFFTILLMSTLWSFGQDTKPVDVNNKILQSPNNPVFYYNVADSTIGLWKGGIYKWNKFFTAKQVQHKIDSLAYHNPYIADSADIKDHIRTDFDKDSLNEIQSIYVVNDTLHITADGSIVNLGVYKDDVDSKLDTTKATVTDRFHWNSAYSWGNWASNFGTTTGTILEGRTFGTAANSASTDFAPSFSGTAGYLSKFTGAGTTIGNSVVYDNGNVGIGTTGPARKLTVYGETTTGQIRVGISDNSYWEIGRENTDNGRFMFTNYNADTPTERLTILANGNVGIGYSSGTEIVYNKLAVNGSGYFNTSLTVNGAASTYARLASFSPTGVLTPITDGTAGQVLKTDGVGGYSWTNWFKSDWNQADSTKNNWIRNKPTISGSNMGDQTLTIAGTTSPTIALSGSTTATFAAGTGITLGQSRGTITITGSGGLSTTPHSETANTSFTLDLNTYVNSKVSTNTAINCTLSNLDEGETGNIEITYTGAAVFTFIVDNSLTLDVSPNILNATTNAYTNTLLSKSTGHYITSYYRSGSTVYINGR